MLKYPRTVLMTLSAKSSTLTFAARYFQRFTYQSWNRARQCADSRVGSPCGFGSISAMVVAIRVCTNNSEFFAMLRCSTCSTRESMKTK
ncbi:hypothetical protein D3C71_2090710 [compost metagenome]